MVVHSPLVLVLPRAAWDRCSPMVCISFFNLENSIGQGEEVWDLVLGIFPARGVHLFASQRCRLDGGDGDMWPAWASKGAPTQATQSLCLGVGHACG